MSVSIPFKREGLSEQGNGIPSEKRKRVSIPFKREGLSEQRTDLEDRALKLEVSIPFKREGLSEPCQVTMHLRNGNPFQFPSNGKVFPNEVVVE